MLLAYTKTTNVAELLASDLPEEPYLVPELVDYFPSALRERYADLMPKHRLRREIVATVVVNDMVNKAGTSFDHRMLEESGASVPDITRAHIAARDVFDLRELWSAVEALDGKVEPGRAARPLAAVAPARRARRAVAAAPPPAPARPRAPTVAAFAPGAQLLMDRFPDVVVGTRAAGITERMTAYEGAGVPHDLARQGASWPLLHTAFDIIEVAFARGRPADEAAAAYWQLFDRARPRLPVGPGRGAAAQRPLADPRPGRTPRRPAVRAYGSCSTRCCGAATCSRPSTSW